MKPDIESDAVLLDRTFVTGDEQYNPNGKVADRVALLLNAVQLDTYNKTYLVRVVVTELATAMPPVPSDDD